MQPLKRYWMVHTHGYPSLRTFETPDEARSHAVNLAILEPNRVFTILEVVDAIMHRATVVNGGMPNAH